MRHHLSSHQNHVSHHSLDGAFTVHARISFFRPPCSNNTHYYSESVRQVLNLSNYSYLTAYVWECFCRRSQTAHTVNVFHILYIEKIERFFTWCKRLRVVCSWYAATFTLGFMMCVKQIQTRNKYDQRKGRDTIVRIVMFYMGENSI